jgi:hypothetical protein
LAGDEPAGDSATAFAEDRDGVIWFGTEKGFIFKVSDSSARKLNLKYPQEPGMVTSMLFDSTGELFLTYERPPYHKGPFRAPEEGGAIEALEVPRAETFKHICCLARDDDNRIWFGTNRGLQLFRDASPRPR